MHRRCSLTYAFVTCWQYHHNTCPGFVDNFGTLYAVNSKVQSVYQEFIGHVTFYTSSPCVWMYDAPQPSTTSSSLSLSSPTSLSSS